jgi:type VI secretion system secreted protein Hcp
MAKVRDFFLRIDGVVGGSNDATHKGEIELLGWSLESDAAGPDTGKFSGKVKISEIRVAKHVDKSSPALRLALASGEHFDSALLTVREAGQNPVEFRKITMSDVEVTSFLIGLDSDGRTPVEKVTLSFAKYEDSILELEGLRGWHVIGP